MLTNSPASIEIDSLSNAATVDAPRVYVCDTSRNSIFGVMASPVRRDLLLALHVKSERAGIHGLGEIGHRLDDDCRLLELGIIGKQAGESLTSRDRFLGHREGISVGH